MSNEYKCGCCKLTVKEINDRFQEKSEADDKALAFGLFISFIVVVNILLIMNFVGLLMYSD